MTAVVLCYLGYASALSRLQQVFWHSGFGFVPSFSQFFLHFLMIVGFFSHLLILILHALLSLRPLQCGSGSHKSQVFWQFCFFFGRDGTCQDGTGHYSPARINLATSAVTNLQQDSRGRRLQRSDRGEIRRPA